MNYLHGKQKTIILLLFLDNKIYIFLFNNIFILHLRNALYIEKCYIKIFDFIILILIFMASIDFNGF